LAPKQFGIRTLVSLIFAPLIILSALQGHLIFLVVISTIVVLGTYEFYNLAFNKSTSPQKELGSACGIILCALAYWGKVEYVSMALLGLITCVLMIELFRDQGSAILNASATIAGVLYVGMTLSTLVWIRELPLITDDNLALGGRIVVLLFVSTWVCDSAAYILGSKIGRHKLFERVSPNKTVEGTVAGFLLALAAACVCHLTFMSHLGLTHVLIIGGICGSVGQLSDLVESLFKRDAGVKDSSNLIPGHGGILDRFDSQILAAPMVFLYLNFVVLG
jgi:phosphatidate cytidylyltransferase